MLPFGFFTLFYIKRTKVATVLVKKERIRGYNFCKIKKV
jgi:hypothetical protein